MVRLLGRIATLCALFCVITQVRVARSEPGSTEVDLYVQAAALEGVPRELLVAIAGAESAFHPWALNIAGHQVYCGSREEAEQLLATADMSILV